jgi:hypothetical protein
MRKLIILAICVGVGGCYWVPKKSSRGTNYDPPSDRTSEYESKRL